MRRAGGWGERAPGGTSLTAPLRPLPGRATPLPSHPQGRSYDPDRERADARSLKKELARERRGEEEGGEGLYTVHGWGVAMLLWGSRLWSGVCAAARAVMLSLLLACTPTYACTSRDDDTQLCCIKLSCPMAAVMLILHEIADRWSLPCMLHTCMHAWSHTPAAPHPWPHDTSPAHAAPPPWLPLLADEEKTLA